MEMRHLLNLWSEQDKKEKQAKVRQLLDNELIFFFKKEGDYFGTSEDGRLIFARIKNPDKDAGPAFLEDACFQVYNLSQTLKQDNIVRKIFYKKDIDDLKIIDREEVEKKLLG